MSIREGDIRHVLVIVGKVERIDIQTADDMILVFTGRNILFRENTRTRIKILMPICWDSVTKQPLIVFLNLDYLLA